MAKVACGGYRRDAVVDTAVEIDDHRRFRRWSRRRLGRRRHRRAGTCLLHCRPEARRPDEVVRDDDHGTCHDRSFRRVHGCLSLSVVCRADAYHPPARACSGCCPCRPIGIWLWLGRPLREAHLRGRRRLDDAARLAIPLRGRRVLGLAADLAGPTSSVAGASPEASRPADPAGHLLHRQQRHVLRSARDRVSVPRRADRLHLPGHRGCAHHPLRPPAAGSPRVGCSGARDRRRDAGRGWHRPERRPAAPGPCAGHLVADHLCDLDRSGCAVRRRARLDRGRGRSTARIGSHRPMVPAASPLRRPQS